MADGMASSAQARRKRKREPLYAVIVRMLRAEIASGKLRVGAKLPSELALMTRFGVSRHTVRDALRTLREEGFVSGRQGFGTTVMARNQGAPYIHQATSISELSQLVSDAPYFVSSSAFVTADAKLAQRLQCSPRRRWLHVSGLRYPKGAKIPICHVDVYIHDRFAELGKLSGKQRVPLYRIIEEKFGERLVEVFQTIRAVVLSRELSGKLKAQEGSPALEIRRIYKTAKGNAVEITLSTCPADRFSYSMLLRRED